MSSLIYVNALCCYGGMPGVIKVRLTALQNLQKRAMNVEVSFYIYRPWQGCPLATSVV